MYYQMTTQGHTNMLNERYCDTIFFIILHMMDDYYHRMKRTIYRQQYSQYTTTGSYYLLILTNNFQPINRQSWYNSNKLRFYISGISIFVQFYYKDELIQKINFEVVDRILLFYCGQFILFCLHSTKNAAIAQNFDSLLF